MVSPLYSVIKSSQIYTSTWGAGLKGRFGIGVTSSFPVWPWNLGPPTFLWRDYKCRPLVSESKPFCHTSTNMSLILHWASARPSGESIESGSITLLAIWSTSSQNHYKPHIYQHVSDLTLSLSSTQWRIYWIRFYHTFGYLIYEFTESLQTTHLPTCLWSYIEPQLDPVENLLNQVLSHFWLFDLRFDLLFC
jgi:hypothetical protein